MNVMAKVFIIAINHNILVIAKTGCISNITQLRDHMLSAM